METSHYIVFRCPSKALELTTENAIGGIVLPCECTYHGHPIGDFSKACRLAEDRYHVAPYETLAVMEVFDVPERIVAYALYEKWRQEQQDFKELMEA